MTVTADKWIRPASAKGSHILRQGAEGASQSFVRGAPLVRSGGYLVVATSGAALDMVGFTAEAAHNDSSAGTHNVLYWPIEENPVFQGQLAGASAHTLAITDIGTAYGLAASSGKWYVDVDESSANQKSATVVDIVDPLGTSDGIVKFVLNKLGNPYVD